MQHPKICLIGDIVVDVTLKSKHHDTKLRLGGITHAARALWAMNVPFDIAYFAPAYLDKQINTYFNHLGCINIRKLGNVSGSPNVFLIGEAKEIGSQEYELLLRDEITATLDENILMTLIGGNYSDYIIFSGNYDWHRLINELPQRIHFDLTNNVKDLIDPSLLTKKIETLFLSTSSDFFHKYYQGSFDSFVKLFSSFTELVILKENRGGSRAYLFNEKRVVSIGSQPRQIMHSVGVGDVYNAIFISTLESSAVLDERLTWASWIAAEYAATSFPDDFKKGASRVRLSNVEDLMKMSGILLPWEKRNKHSIYIAAPDFSFINTECIDQLESALLYHNFKPRRPIKENGEMEESASKHRRQQLFSKDIALLKQCSLLIAVLLNDDAGTMIELGYAAANGIPVIVFDPFNRAFNCILTELPDLLTSDMEEVITEVFAQIAKI